MQQQLPPQAAIMHVVAGYWLSRAVYLAARLKLADAVDERATLAALAAATGTRPEALRRLMRALTSHGYFREAEDGAFDHTSLSEALRSGGPGSMRAIAEAELGHDPTSLGVGSTAACSSPALPLSASTACRSGPTTPLIRRRRRYSARRCRT